MNISGLPLLVTVRCYSAAQDALIVANTQPITEILAGTNTLSTADVDGMLVACDGNGLLNGTFDSVGQTPLAPPSPAGQAAITSLVGKGWTVTTDPWQFTFDDGGGGFWDLVVDTTGNVGTTSGIAPATADVILADGVGGFWKVAVDVTGLRYTIADPGPATAAPVLFDGEGGFWQLVVDALGNLGATLVYHYPVYWEPYTEIVTWTDTNGVQAGNLVDFTATVDLATLTNVTASGLAITELIFDGTQLPALTTIDCSSSVSLTNLKVPNCSALVTLDCNNCDITGILDMSGLSNLITLVIESNVNLTSVLVTNCTSLTTISAAACNIASIDLHTCVSLTTVDLDGNGSLTAIDITTAPGVTTLDYLACSFCDVGSIDLSGNPNITSFACSYPASGTTLINITGCVQLQQFGCAAISLAALDITPLTQLLNLDCSGNNIGNLDASLCTNLQSIVCNNNSITSLNIAGCTQLVSIQCQSNSMNSASVDAVLCAADTNGALNGLLNILLNSVPTASGLVCSANLDPGKGWTVTHD